jgi:N-acetylmuramoyl-L-alanine amidase
MKATGSSRNEVATGKEALVRWICLAALALLVSLVGLFALTPASAQAPASAVAGKVICIDPGHGGTEAGAVYHKRGRPGSRWTLYEKDINLDVAKALQGLLVRDGATVVMTREDDSSVSLERRVEICNAAAADITVSVHTNSTNSSRWDGSMTLVAKDDDWPLAEAIHPVMYEGLEENWEGRFTDYGIREGVWYIPLNTSMPAVILEPVFMSNHDEAAALHEEHSSRRAQIVQVEYDGIVAYFADP